MVSGDFFLWGVRAHGWWPRRWSLNRNQMTYIQKGDSWNRVYFSHYTNPIDIRIAWLLYFLSLEDSCQEKGHALSFRYRISVYIFWIEFLKQNRHAPFRFLFFLKTFFDVFLSRGASSEPSVLWGREEVIEAHERWVHLSFRVRAKVSFANSEWACMKEEVLFFSFPYYDDETHDTRKQCEENDSWYDISSIDDSADKEDHKSVEELRTEILEREECRAVWGRRETIHLSRYDWNEKSSYSLLCICKYKSKWKDEKCHSEITECEEEWCGSICRLSEFFSIEWAYLLANAATIWNEAKMIPK